MNEKNTYIDSSKVGADECFDKYLNPGHATVLILHTIIVLQYFPFHIKVPLSTQYPLYLLNSSPEQQGSQGVPISCHRQLWHHITLQLPTNPKSCWCKERGRSEEDRYFLLTPFLGMILPFVPPFPFISGYQGRLQSYYNNLNQG